MKWYMWHWDCNQLSNTRKRIGTAIEVRAYTERRHDAGKFPALISVMGTFVIIFSRRSAQHLKRSTPAMAENSWLRHKPLVLDARRIVSLRVGCSAYQYVASRIVRTVVLPFLREVWSRTADQSEPLLHSIIHDRSTAQLSSTIHSTRKADLTLVLFAMSRLSIIHSLVTSKVGYRPVQYYKYQ